MQQADSQVQTAAESPAPRLRLRARLSRGAFWLWALLSFALAASLMVAHTYALPRPATDDPALRAAIAQTRDPSERGRFRALHVLYSRCRCSQRILTQLFARGAMAEVSERLVLVGAHAEYERAALAAGFTVDVIAPEQLVGRYGVTAAPLLVVADPSDALGYVGGYSERKQGLDQKDVEIISALRAGERRAELPLFGCAVSASLQRFLDPLGLNDSFVGDR